MLLPASPFGHAGQGLAQNVAAGNVGLLASTHVVEDAIEEFKVDGVKMIFQNTPGTEAPAEMNTKTVLSLPQLTTKRGGGKKIAEKIFTSALTEG